MSEFERPAGLSDLDLGYSAAFMDAEGSIGVSRRPHRVFAGLLTFSAHAALSQNDKGILEWYASIWGGAVNGPHPPRGGAAPWYSWRVSYRLCRNYLEVIWPYLRQKQPQALNALGLLRLQAGRTNRPKPLTPTEYAQHQLFYERHRELGLARNHNLRTQAALDIKHVPVADWTSGKQEVLVGV